MELEVKEISEFEKYITFHVFMDTQLSLFAVADRNLLSGNQQTGELYRFPIQTLSQGDEVRLNFHPGVNGETDNLPSGQVMYHYYWDVEEHVFDDIFNRLVLVKIKDIVNITSM